MEGFYTALGTPLDEMGNFYAPSFKKQIEDQVDHGAAGVLVLGSMGMQPCVKHADCAKVAQAAVEAVKGRCHVTVGVMDNSIATVMDRIEALKGLPIDGVVVTTPFYFTATRSELLAFFRAIASKSPFPIYLYDLPSVTKLKIDASMVHDLMGLPNLAGIKTADLVLSRAIFNDSTTKNDFKIFCSNLDAMDFAYKCGLKVGLDGMFTMTAPLISKAFSAMKESDFGTAAKAISDIIAFRDLLVEVEVMVGFTHAMNLLGYEGNFHTDYTPLLTDDQKESVRSFMQSVGLL